MSATQPQPTTHYLEHLPVSQAVRSPRPGAPRPTVAARFRHLLGLLVLLAVASGAAVAFARLAGGQATGPPARWPQHGCLGAPVDPLGRAAVTGQAQLCPSDGGTATTLDLEHLEPMARYGTWVAYFEQPSRCRFAALQLQVPTFHQPCTLADLAEPDPKGIVQLVGETLAGPYGATHVDELLYRPGWLRHAQVWLLVGRPPTPTRVDPQLFEARAIFELP